MALSGQAGAGWREVAQVLSRGGREVRLRGLTPAAGAYMLARLFGGLGRPLLLITPDTSAQETFLKDLAFFLGPGAVASDSWPPLQGFPAHELLPFQQLTFDAEVSAARVGGAYLLLTGPTPVFLVAPAAALRQKLPPARRLREAYAYLVAGAELDRQAFLRQLIQSGYERRPIVEERGEFSIRGGIIDLFPPIYARPVRLEFWGDEVDTLRFFDPK